LVSVHSCVLPGYDFRPVVIDVPLNPRKIVRFEFAKKLFRDQSIDWTITGIFFCLQQALNSKRPFEFGFELGLLRGSVHKDEALENQIIAFSPLGRAARTGHQIAQSRNGIWPPGKISARDSPRWTQLHICESGRLYCAIIQTDSVVALSHWVQKPIRLSPAYIASNRLKVCSRHFRWRKSSSSPPASSERDRPGTVPRDRSDKFWFRQGLGNRIWTRDQLQSGRTFEWKMRCIPGYSGRVD
jgi:hypothetical protein